MEQTHRSNSIKTLSFVRRNLKVDSSSIKKTHAYQALVRPKLEYCSSVWDPYTAENNYKLEKVQRRAARYVCHRYHNTSSVTEMIWAGLHLRNVVQKPDWLTSTKFQTIKWKYRTQKYLYQINQKPELHTQKHLDNCLAKKTALNIISFVLQYRIGINSLKP